MVFLEIPNGPKGTVFAKKITNMGLSESDSGSDGDSKNWNPQNYMKKTNWLKQAVAWHWISYVEHKALHGVSDKIL